MANMSKVPPIPKIPAGNIKSVKVKIKAKPVKPAKMAGGKGSMC